MTKYNELSAPTKYERTRKKALRRDVIELRNDPQVPRGLVREALERFLAPVHPRAYQHVACLPIVPCAAKGPLNTPIVPFASEGVVTFGKRTMATEAARTEPSSLDKINVQRMLLHAERACKEAVKGYVGDTPH